MLLITVLLFPCFSSLHRLPPQQSPQSSQTGCDFIAGQINQQLPEAWLDADTEEMLLLHCPAQQLTSEFGRGPVYSLRWRVTLDHLAI